MTADRQKGFTLLELMVVVAILSVLASVAIPAFIKYMRRVKTVEAIDELQKLHSGSAAYYARGQVLGGVGAALPCQFTRSIGVTPDMTNKQCCGGALDSDKDNRCDVDSVAWDQQVWESLNFEMRDQHYFGYSYTSSGTLGDSLFVARAQADLDCDGITSTFERYGFGDKDASRRECSAVSGAALYIQNETE